MSFLDRFKASAPTTPPGDFTLANARLIEEWGHLLRVSKLWREEAAEAARANMGARAVEADEIAKRAADLHREIVAFYSRWEIRR